MTTAGDLLDSMKRARDGVRAAEAHQHEVERLLRDAKKAVVAAKAKYELATEEAFAERRQPSLFDAGADVAPQTYHDKSHVPAGERHGNSPAPEPLGAVCPGPTWRTMSLEATGWADNLTPDVWDAIKGAPTAGVLADRLLAGETFGLPLFDLESVYALVEMISEDDERPIDFDAHFNPEPPTSLTAAPATKLADLDDFPEEEEGPRREDYPPDQAGEVEFRLVGHAARGINRSPHDLGLIELIAKWRQRSADGKAEPDWDKWSEFELLLTDGRTVRVCYCPEKFGTDHFEFFGDATSETGYRSDFAHYPNGMRPRIPLDAYALKRAEELAAELKPKPKKERKKKAAEHTKRFPNSGPVPASIPLTTWDGIPNFPALTVEHLAAHKIHCLADLDAHRDKIRKQRGRQQADRYEALRDLATPHTFTAGDAIVDYEIAKVKATEAEPSPAAKKSKRKAVKK